MVTDEELRERLAAVGITIDEADADWDDPDDLSRMSIAAMQATDATAREAESAGVLRITGAGVSDHSAPFDEVGGLMVAWQKVVTALGARRAGLLGLRGRIPQEIVARTKLLLDATPAPGSLVLDMRPDLARIDDVHPMGEPLFDAEAIGLEPERALSDAAVEEAAKLLDVVSQESIVQDTLAAQLRQHGPRVAAALKELLERLERSSFDTTIRWYEPGRSRVRASVSAAAARRAAQSIAARRLDAEVITLVGTLVTSSSEERLALRTVVDEFEERIPIARGELSTDDLRRFPIDSQVRMDVRMHPVVTPGGETRYSYEAISIEPGDQPALPD